MTNILQISKYCTVFYKEIFCDLWDQLYYKIEKTRKQQQESKKRRFLEKSQKCSLGPYDKIKKCSDCHHESSHTCKNSSRRTPRFKNLNFLFFVQITFTCTC